MTTMKNLTPMTMIAAQARGFAPRTIAAKLIYYGIACMLAIASEAG